MLLELAFEFREGGADAGGGVGGDGAGVQSTGGQHEIYREIEIGAARAKLEIAVQLHEIRRVTLEQLFEFRDMACHNFLDRLPDIRLNAAEGHFHRSTLMEGLNDRLESEAA